MEKQKLLSFRSLVKVTPKRDKVERVAFPHKGDEMRRFKMYNALSLSLIMVVGCSTPEFEAEQARKAQQVEQQEQTLRHGHPGKVLMDALGQLDLRPEQRRQLDVTHSEIMEKMATMTAQHAGLAQTFGTAIRSGAVDTEQLRSSFSAFIRSAAEMKPVFIKSLNQGHKVLDPAQRAKLVQILKAHHEKRAKGCKGHEHFKRLGAKIGITDQQRQQLRQLVLANMTADERAEMEQRRTTWRERHLAALEAFKGDGFDAAKLPAFNRPPRDRLRAERVVRLLNLALPMLKSEQRVNLAKSIELRSASFIAELKKDRAALLR
jgi:Spy/CpxP family protein refolding chaperone